MGFGFGRGSVLGLARAISVSSLKLWLKMRCRLPSSAWPIRQASGWLYLRKMAMMSLDMAPSLDVSQATSSSSMLEPGSRAPPTMGMRPWRAVSTGVDK